MTRGTPRFAASHASRTAAAVQQHDDVFSRRRACRRCQVDLGPVIVLGEYFEENDQDRDKDGRNPGTDGESRDKYHEEYDKGRNRSQSVDKGVSLPVRLAQSEVLASHSMSARGDFRRGQRLNVVGGRSHFSGSRPCVADGSVSESNR